MHRVGQNSLSLSLSLYIYIYIYIYMVYERYFWQGVIKYTVIYGKHIRLWPALLMLDSVALSFTFY